MQITGAELLVKALQAEKVDMLFAYPGGQVIDIFDALYGVEEFDVMMQTGLEQAKKGESVPDPCCRWLCPFDRKNRSVSCDQRSGSCQSGYRDSDGEL